jgi:hypothetical protein
MTLPLDDIEILNEIIRRSGQMEFDKDLSGFRFSCYICGNTGYVGGEDGAILHSGERPECNVCGFRGISLFKFKNHDNDMSENAPNSNIKKTGSEAKI